MVDVRRVRLDLAAVGLALIALDYPCFGFLR